MRAAIRSAINDRLNGVRKPVKPPKPVKPKKIRGMSKTGWPADCTCTSHYVKNRCPACVNVKKVREAILAAEWEEYKKNHGL